MACVKHRIHVLLGYDILNENRTKIQRLMANDKTQRIKAGNSGVYYSSILDFGRDKIAQTFVPRVAESTRPLYSL